MTIFLLVLVGLVIGVVGLAQYWARTPHGRIKPLFALVFRLQQIFGAAAAEGALCRPMGTPEEREKARNDFLHDTARLSRPLSFDGEAVDRVIEGPGGPLPIRIYTPAGEGPWPLLLYAHGGGFIVGDPDYTDAVTRQVAADAPAVVVSVDYRLAPEAPWPAAVEDADYALRWCLDHADELGIDAGRVAVGGDSAGGNLAAILALRDRARGDRRIGLQVLIYPAVDATRRDRESQLAFGRGYGLSLLDLEVCFGHYAPDGADLENPDLSPLHAASHEGLPRALVFTAGFDVLRDEGTEYAERLEKAGVPVEHVRQPEMPHGYITMTRFCREARDDIDRIAAAVRAL